MLGTARPIQDRFLQELEKRVGSRAEFYDLGPTLARISRESPNILPLLNFIPPAWWPRLDLLQDKVLRAASPVFKNFSPAALRWLRRAPAETLASFHHCYEKFIAERDEEEEDQPHVAGEVARLMADLPPRVTEQPELAETVMAYYLDLLDYVIEWGPSWSPADMVLINRLLRLQARHIVALWDSSENPKEELEGVKEELEDEAVFILDWFIYRGHPLGLPDKKSTWRSLKRHADKRREAICREQLRENENFAWESLLGETVIDGLKITPLLTGLDLYNEGRAMRHCVGTYALRCQYAGWRVFSLWEEDGTRSTLSLKPGDDGFTIDQHYGPENRPVSPAAARAAREVCRLYNQKFREATETAVTGAAA